MPTINSDNLLKWPIELLRIVQPPEAERLSSTSWDTLQRNHPDKVVHLSKRRVGMRVGHALMLGVKSPPDSVFDTCNNWAQPSVSAAGVCEFRNSENRNVARRLIPKIGISHFAIEGTVYGVPVRNFFCTDAVFGGDAFPNFDFRHTSPDLGGPRYVAVRPLVLHEFEDGLLQGGPLALGWRGFQLWLGPLRADWRPGDPL